MPSCESRVNSDGIGGISDRLRVLRYQGRIKLVPLKGFRISLASGRPGGPGNPPLKALISNKTTGRAGLFSQTAVLHSPDP